MDKIEYRAVIKLFVKEGLTPNKIHSKFIKVYGDSSPSPNLYGIYHCCVYNEKLLMTDRGTVRNM
jgi:hypothetical protein